MELTREQAVELFESNWWEGVGDFEIVKFQLFTERLCMPFSRFHQAVEKILERPVYTHEFAFEDHLKKEFLGEKTPPTFEEILDLIPPDKRIVLGVSNGI